MSSEQTRAHVHEGYDVTYVQEKWLPVWDKLEPFKSGRADDALKGVEIFEPT